MTHRVFLDSNVLASRTIRDWVLLCRLRSSNTFQVHTTLDVLAETIRAVRRRYPNASGAIIADLDTKIRQAVDELIVDFPGGIPFAGKDPHDRHINAAATHAKSDIVVTENAKDFGDPTLLPFDLYTADEFLCLIDDSSPGTVRLVATEQHEYWRRRQRDGLLRKGVAQALAEAGCPHFAARVAAHLLDIDGTIDSPPSTPGPGSTPHLAG